MSINTVRINYALNVGEVSARFEGRQDKQEKYNAACRILENWLPLTVGGVTRRPGFGFVAKTKFSGASNDTVVLIDFRKSSTQAYVLEFGDLYVRFFKDGVPLMRATQPVTGITQASSAVVTYTGADSYVVGNKVTITGVVGMTEINGLEATITAVNTGANTITLNINSTAFTAYTSGGVINTPFELVTPFHEADLDLIHIGSFQSADVMYLCTGIYPVQKLSRISVSPDVFTIGQVAFDPPATIQDTPTGAEIGSGTVTLSALTGSGITATAASASFLAGDVGRTIVSGGGRALVTSFTSTTVLVCDVIDDFSSTTLIDNEWHFEGFGNQTMDPNARLVGNGVSVSASVNTFRTTDAGKYMTIYGGLIKLSAYVSATKMTGTILNTLRDVPNDPATGLPYTDPPATAVWTIEVPAWTDALGYPTCGCFFQGRMWLCQGQTINASVSGDFENFSKGSNDDDAIQRTIDDDQVNPIRWIKGLRSLQQGTGGNAYETTASPAGAALTPSNFTELPISSRGSANIPPVKVGGQLLYVQYGQKKVRELVYDFVTDKYKSPTLLVLAEHLTEYLFLMDLAYQQEPDSIIWFVRDDGQLLALTYQEDENVIAWSRHVTNGLVKSVSTIPRPSTGKDWLWAAIKRTINGVAQTFVEYMEPDANVTREWKGLQTDCAKIVAPDTALAVTGLDHLEGETVHVIGDGMQFNDAVVTNGGFTLSPAVPVSQVEVGLDYQSTGLTCEPFISPQEGGMFVCRRWKNLGVRVRHAGPGLTVNPEGSGDIGLAIRRPDMPMDQAVLLQEGKLCAEQTNFGAFQRVYFKQTRPFPAEIIDINGELEISDEWCCDTVDENPDFGALVDNSSIFGLLKKECGHTCALGQFAQATYEGGTYPGGPAIRITDNSTNTAMFGLAAIYVPDQNVLALVLYAGENLSDVGTVITSVAATLVAGDVIKIESDIVTDTTYRVKINGTTVITQSLANDTLSVVGGCVGFVKLAGVAGTITPPVGEQAMIITQANDLSKTDNTLVDTDLVLAVEANSTYVGSAALLITSASSTPDALLQLNGPSGAAALIFDPAWTYSTFALGAPATFSVVAATPTVVHLDITIRVGSTAGNITLQFAQNATNATATILAKDSNLMLFKKV